MKVLLMVAGADSSVDQMTGQVSIFKVLEELHVPLLPFITPPIDVVTHLEREKDEPEEDELTSRILLNDRALFTVATPVKFHGKPRTRITGKIGGLVIDQPGRLVFDVVYKGNVIGSWPVLVSGPLTPTASLAADGEKIKLATDK